MQSQYHLRRNRRIRELYRALTQSGTPRMHAYAHIAALYELSEDRVRKIVHRY